MIQISKKTGLVIIKLNRPEKRNALHPQMISQIKDEIDILSKDKEAKALIVTGEGSSFCAGADLEYLNKLQDFSSIENEKDSQSLAELFLKIYQLKIPTIAAVNGPAIAGGCGLATVCDFIVADIHDAKFGYSEVRIGFIPAIVSIFLMRKIGVGNSKKLLLTGETINAQEAKNIGLADIVSENVMEESLLFIKKLLAGSQSSYAMTKEMINNISTMNIDDAVDYCIRINTISRSTEDFKERIKNFLKKQ
jgi:methylglutaconyl-CoA hydratase